jgi:predicted  nucleic acid-binding Zn-ribbon protein
LTSLQEILEELDKIEEETLRKSLKLEEIKSRLKQKKKILQEKQNELKKKQDEKLNLELQIREIELKIKEEEEKIKKWERQLRETKNYREQIILMNEISEAKKVKNQLEEEELKFIIKKDEVEKALSNMVNEMEEYIERESKEIDEMEKEVDKIEEEIKILQKRKEEVFWKIRELYPDVFRKYEEMRGRPGSKIVAKIEDGVCSACNIVIFPDILARLYANPDGFETCPNCGAILYVDHSGDGTEGA